MNEGSDCPLGRTVALRAVLSEQFEVRIFRRVTTDTVQTHLDSRDLRMLGACAFGRVMSSNPRDDLITSPPLLVIGLIRAEFA